MSRSLGPLAVLSLAGCTGGEKLPTVPASGIVTYNGTAVEGATVSFIPKNAGEGNAKGAGGQTDAQGRFSLQTHLVGDKTAAGALPGDYLVSVSKVEFMRPGAGGKDAAKIQQQAIEKAKSAPAPQGGGRQGMAPSASPMMGGGAMRGKSLLPEKYGNATGSGLTATIGTSGKTDLKFELTD